MSSSLDPSVEAKAQIEQLLTHVGNLFERIETVGSIEKLNGKERDWLITEVRNSVRSADWDLDDLEHTVSQVELCREQFGLTPLVIEEHRAFITRSRSYIHNVRQKLCTNDENLVFPTAEMSSGGGYKYSRLSDSPTSSTQFVNETLQKQQEILKEQDEDLELVGESVHVLKNISHQIGNELEEQSVMLDELGTDMERADTKLDGVMKKIARVTNMKDDRRQWTAIFVLSGILFFIILLFIIL